MADDKVARALSRRRRYHARRNDPWRVDGEEAPPTYHQLKLPLEPLLVVLHASPQAISRLVDTDRAHLYKGIQRGHIGLWTADRICTRLGRHIDEVYAEELAS